jgi:hypothetical protein
MGAADGCKNLANRAIKIEGYPGKDRKKQTCTTVINTPV